MQEGLALGGIRKIADCDPSNESESCEFCFKFLKLLSRLPLMMDCNLQEEIEPFLHKLFLVSVFYLSSRNQTRKSIINQFFTLINFCL